MAIIYLKGDATRPQGEDLKLITHVCNDVGAWGKGFVLAISKRWASPEMAYRWWHSRWREPKPDVRVLNTSPFGLGAVQFVRVQPDIIVANMIAQKGLAVAGAKDPPIQYNSLGRCFRHVAITAFALGASIHMPRVGCGLAGGRWESVEPLIEKHLVGMQVYVYDL